MHVGGGENLHLSQLQENKDVHHGGGRSPTAKKCCPRAGLGEEQSSDGNLEQETEEKWVSCDP